MNKRTISGLLISNFQQVVDGKETKLGILTNKDGCEVTILNYGARIVSIMVPDRDGVLTDVVTGYASVNDYIVSDQRYFGAVCGRYCNRIANGRFTLDGILYDQLATNNGPHCLHGGLKGFNAVVWDMIQEDEQTVVLKYRSADGEEGFPGNLVIMVTYRLTDNNELGIIYEAVTDKPTVLNLTNHSFFNLSGEGNPSIDDHILCINADHYLPTDDRSIPYGPKEKVEGTPMDFQTPHLIGERINDNFEQLLFGNGYDHNYLLNKEQPKSFPPATDEEQEDKVIISYCASCIAPKTGILLTVYTTEPGVQLYTGNWMSGKTTGKNGHVYPKRSAFCLETQHFPDSPNQPEYPSTILRPGEVFESHTVYKFSKIKYSF